MGKERRKINSRYKKPEKQKLLHRTRAEEASISTLTQPTVQTTNAFYRWWNTLSTTEKVFFLGLGATSVMLFFYITYSYKSNSGNLINHQDAHPVAKSKGDSLTTSVPVYSPTFFSEVAHTRASEYSAKEKKVGMDPSEDKKVHQSATSLLAQCDINLSDISYIPSEEELSLPVTLERFLQKTTTYYTQDMVLTPELATEINQKGRILTNLILGMLASEPEFAADFSFVFNHPDFKITMYPSSNTVRGKTGIYGGSYGKGTLMLNLNNLDGRSAIAERISTIRHEIRHARMDFENSLYKNLRENPNYDFIIPYNLFGIANTELKAKFKKALKSDLQTCNSIKVTAKTQETYREVLESSYQPQLLERFLFPWQFKEIQKKLDASIQTRQYMPVPLFDPHEPGKQDISIYPIYYTDKTKNGVPGVMLRGYTVPDIEKSLLQSFLNEVKLLKSSIARGYSHLSADQQDAEWDAFLAGYGEDMAKHFFPNLRDFHNEKRKLVKEIMAELSGSKHNEATSSNSNSMRL